MTKKSLPVIIDDGWESDTPGDYRKLYFEHRGISLAATVPLHQGNEVVITELVDADNHVHVTVTAEIRRMIRFMCNIEQKKDFRREEAAEERQALKDELRDVDREEDN